MNSYYQWPSYHELALDVGISDSLAVILHANSIQKFKTRLQAHAKKDYAYTSTTSLTHFIKRMLPGEYCTKRVFTRRPQPTQRGASPSVSASPITPNLFARAP